MKPTEQYFPVVLFIMLYKVVLTFDSADEILKRDHSYESYIGQYLPVLLLIMLLLLGFVFPSWVPCADI